MGDERLYTIPDDLKITIAKIIALQSLATDPGQQLMMTASVMRWVRVGLYMKYNAVPDSYIGSAGVERSYEQIFNEGRALWQEAMAQYSTGQEFWSHALMRCADIADDMATIAGIENMLDYRQLDFDFTMTTFGPSAEQITDEDLARKRTEAATNRAKPGSGAGGMG